MFSFIKRIFGTAQSRTVAKYRSIADAINQVEEGLQRLSDDELKAKTAEFRARYLRGETLDDLLVEAYAVVKNACRRIIGSEFHVSGYNQRWDMIPYDVQLIGAIALHKGYITEMQTGEGKTITAVLPLYLNALTGKPVHIVTANDYLAARDCQWVGTLHRWLGLTTGVITQDVAYEDRHEIYQCDIVYGTASEFGFDYLRDNSMATSKESQVQRGFYYALIDEADSILIDEARTPLIISGPATSSRQLYDLLQAPVERLVAKQKEYCNCIALQAKKGLENFLKQEDASTAWEFSDAEKEAIRKLWLVNKGTPRNKILKRLREEPDIRSELEKWDLYYYSEANKEERAKTLADLFIIVDEKSNDYELTDKGIAAWQECGGKEDDFVMLDLGGEYQQIDADFNLTAEEKMAKKLALQDEDITRKERAHNLRQLLRAHLLMESDVDYIVQENKIIIIDENTGRPQPGRRFSDGLHQAIEAKESVPIQRETQTYATITIQNYFRMYEKLAGMTGTAITEAHEFKEIYKLNVIQIPTHKPCRRKDANDEMYMTEREKYNAILKEIKDVHEQGRPILIGTESVEISEKLSRIFKLNRLEHTVLNAKNNTREAEIIASAGQRGAITVSTNMAGRGTDIKLGPGIAELGGLHVVGTTRHQSRRIDRQLRGRSGRQGDPGSSKFFISLEDSLMRLFSSPTIVSMLQRFRPPEGEPVTAPILNRSIETAQKRIEQRNYTIRKHTLEYDDVMNKQRQEIYTFRQELIQTEEPLRLAAEVIENLCQKEAEQFFRSREKELGWDPEGFRLFLTEHFPITFPHGYFDDDRKECDELAQLAYEKIVAAFHEKIDTEAKNTLQIVQDPQFDPRPILANAIRNMMIHTIDHLWQEHLLAMDHLRADVHLRSVAQKDPLMEFKHEAFRLFDEFTQHVRIQMAKTLFHFEITARPRIDLHGDADRGPPMGPDGGPHGGGPVMHHKRDKFAHPPMPFPLPPPEFSEAQMEHGRSFASDFDEVSAPQDADDAAGPSMTLSSDPKTKRNQLCPCGSQKKFKKCCGAGVHSE